MYYGWQQYWNCEWSGAREYVCFIKYNDPSHRIALRLVLPLKSRKTDCWPRAARLLLFDASLRFYCLDALLPRRKRSSSSILSTTEITSASAPTLRTIGVSKRKWRTSGETRTSGHVEAFTRWPEWASLAPITRSYSKWAIVYRISKYCQCVWGVRPMHKATSEIRRTRSFPRLNSLPKDFVHFYVCK